MPSKITDTSVKMGSHKCEVLCGLSPSRHNQLISHFPPPLSSISIYLVHCLRSYHFSLNICISNKYETNPFPIMAEREARHTFSVGLTLILIHITPK